jgi:hypothetical protein
MGFLQRRTLTARNEEKIDPQFRAEIPPLRGRILPEKTEESGKWLPILTNFGNALR